MESYEVEINGKTYPVKPVRNISAHNIKHYQIHGGKSIPFIKNSDQTKRKVKCLPLRRLVQPALDDFTTM
jgi:methionine aminopeptidase